MFGYAASLLEDKIFNLIIFLISLAAALTDTKGYNNLKVSSFINFLFFILNVNVSHVA